MVLSKVISGERHLISEYDSCFNKFNWLIKTIPGKKNMRCVSARKSFWVISHFNFFTVASGYWGLSLQAYKSTTEQIAFE